MPSEFLAVMEPLAKHFFGAPNAALSSEHELRYGSHGSMAIDLRKGTFYDHEACEGGGVLDLVSRETTLTGPARLDWLKAHGFVWETHEGNGVTAPRPSIVATYDYCDEAGVLLSQVCRFQPKDFRQRCSDGNGGWIWSVKGVRKVPYRLPELLEAGDRVVFIVEGERDVDRLWALGIPATCNIGGAGKWKAELSEFFRGGDVVVIPDRDQAGQDHAENVAKLLSNIAARVRVLELWRDWPEMPHKGDVSDWIAHGGTAERLYGLVAKYVDAPVTPVTPVTPKPKRRFELVPFNAIKIDTAPNYLVKGVIPRGGMIVIWGPPKCGKSFWTFDLMMHVALGWKYRGRRVQRGVIVYLALEGGNGFRARVEAWRRQHLADHQGDVPFYLISTGVDLVRDQVALVASIKTELGNVRPDAVVIDTLNRALIGDENSSEDMAKFIRAADEVRATFDCAAIIVHHCGIQGTRPRGHTSLTGADDAQIAVDRVLEDGGTITATIEHMKDGPDGGSILSRLEQVELGEDDDGDLITSCIIVPVEGDVSTKPQPGKLTNNDKLALDALKHAMVDNSCNQIPQAGQNRVCPVEAWRSYFYAVKDGDRDTQKKAFQRAREKLQVLGFISTWKDYAWLTGQRDSDGTVTGHVPQDTGGTGQGHTLKSVPPVPPSPSRFQFPVGSASFQVLSGEPLGTPCSHCQQTTGQVFLIRDPFRGVASHALHEQCAIGFYSRGNGRDE